LRGRRTQTDEFEWDDDKATRNLIKHCVSFAQATFAFDDPDGSDEPDEETDEETAELRTREGSARVKIPRVTREDCESVCPCACFAILVMWSKEARARGACRSRCPGDVTGDETSKIST
jgi:hypothetical protein